MLVAGVAARAQSIEPRAYAPAPTGVNVLVVGIAHSSGGFPDDASSPVENPRLNVETVALGYVRSFALGGRQGKVDVSVPLSDLEGSGIYRGVPSERSVRGLADPSVRVSVLLHGAPPLTLKEFARFKQDWVVGASLRVTAPLGQYDADRLVNLGLNRWSVKPELGVSKRFGSLLVEGATSVTLFTDNDDFLGNNRRSQDPLFAARAHVSLNLPRGAWASVDATAYGGGGTRVNGVYRGDLQQNLRTGATRAIPVSRRNVVRIFGSRGVYARTGNEFDLVGFALQHSWGAGL